MRYLSLLERPIHMEALEIEKKEAQCLLALLTLLETQTQQKLASSILKYRISGRS